MREHVASRITFLVVLALAVGPGTACVKTTTASPGADVHPLGKRAEAPNGLVTSAHPLASDAGLAMLVRGGNAIDAAVAIAFAIGVVEPMMSGLGGGGGMLIWRQDATAADYLEFYATAPAGTDPAAADIGEGPARLVAVPGAVKGLLTAHERYGELSREEVLEPALRLAEEGFPVSPLLARTIAENRAKLTRTGRAQELFWPAMKPLEPGARLIQPELAATLRRVAGAGAAGFHEGPVAEEIVGTLRAGGSRMTRADLADYRPVWRRPVCGTFRGRTVLAAPPPQSGMQVVESLHLLDRLALSDDGLPVASPVAFHGLVSALRASTADRRAFAGDPDRSQIPAAALTSHAYAAARELPADVPKRFEAGDPWNLDPAPPIPACARLDAVGPIATRASESANVPPAAGPPPAVEGEGAGGETTHLSVVDRHGNAVSLTITQGAYFGSGVWAAGTFLNNAMSLFSSDPGDPNELRPGARPVSTTSPTVLLEDGRVRMVVGSPGGGRIPGVVVQSIVYVLEYGMDPLDAIEMPRVYVRFSSPTVSLEPGFGADVIGAARDMGYTIDIHPPLSLYFGGVHLIDRRNGRWVGAADPRRDGQVRGY